MRDEVIRILDRTALIGMALGVLLLLSPWGAWSFRAGFFAMLVFTILHIVTSHLVKPEEP